MLWAQAAKPQQPSTTTANKNPTPNPDGRISNQVAMPANPTFSGKSAQKPRFCARNARKRGFRQPKAHKNPDFVLETPENEGFEAQKSTKTPILCSKRREIGIGKHNRGAAYRKLELPANHRARFKNCKNLRKATISAEHRGIADDIYMIFMGCPFAQKPLTSVPSCVTFSE